METTVVNLIDEPYDVYIGRAGRGQDGYFGNPFKLIKGESRGDTLNKYKDYFYKRLVSDPEFRYRVHELKGKVLGCFCKPYPCHGDVIVTYLNNSTDEKIYD